MWASLGTLTDTEGRAGPANAQPAAQESSPRIEVLETQQPTIPVLQRKASNPVLGLCVQVKNGIDPEVLTGVDISLDGTSRPRDVAVVEMRPGPAHPNGPFGSPIASISEPRLQESLQGTWPLKDGANWFWICVRLRDGADLDGRVRITASQLRAGQPNPVSIPPQPPGGLRIGLALRQRGDDGSQAYRIPGLTQTTQGTLLAVYDVRYRGERDLPGDIDVGLSRSEDGGRSWEPMRIVLDLGHDPEFAYDGVGDPCILVDRVSGRVWIAALWSHGEHGWNGSGPGLGPDQTGQLVLTYSDDDGRTWSPPRNITRQVKDPAWRLMLAAPGAGITTTEGHLVIPAQYRAANAPPYEGRPFATVITSPDHGQTWQVGGGVRENTTESQVVQLGDGSLMINARDDRGGARTVAVSRDLGRTWTPHSSDRHALPEPVCMASLLRWDHPIHGPLLLFSNPASTSTRHHMTVKVSRDDGRTWPERLHTLYDVRRGSCYSCLAPIGESHVGVLYEGPAEIYFLRLSLKELLEPLH